MIYHDLVQDLDSSPFKKLFDNGITHEDISKVIQNTFSPFFENKNMLERFSKDFLIHDFINYCKNHYTDINENISSILKILQKSKSTNESNTFENMAKLQIELVEASNKHWSFCILQKDFSTLDKYEYVTEAFSLIENICENSLKAYLMFLLLFYRIINNGNSDIEQIKSLKFGNIVDELNNFDSIKIAFKTVGNDVTISQWRNIACHKSYKIYNNTIICTYGRNNSKTYTVKSKEDLLSITKAIYRIFQAANFAFKFFLYDNIERIHMYYKGLPVEIESRDENWHLPFSTEMYMHGFKVDSIIKQDENIKVELSDVNKQESEIRKIQSSIAIFKVWYYSSCKNIEITYKNSDNRIVFRVKSTDEVCRMIASGGKDISYLAEKMEIVSV